MGSAIVAAEGLRLAGPPCGSPVAWRSPPAGVISSGSVARGPGVTGGRRRPGRTG